MTSEEYAEMVRRTIMDTRHAGVAPEGAGMDYAFTALSRRSADRCIGPGADQYEVEPDTQRFEDRDLLDIVEDAREEVLDLPAYLTQIEYRLSLLGEGSMSPDVREGIILAARLMVILERLEEQVAGEL
jgi:hypothetical protein